MQYDYNVFNIDFFWKRKSHQANFAMQLDFKTEETGELVSNILVPNQQSIQAHLAINSTALYYRTTHNGTKHKGTDAGLHDSHLR